MGVGGIGSGYKGKKLIVTDEQKDPAQGSLEILVVSPDRPQILPPWGWWVGAQGHDSSPSTVPTVHSFGLSSSSLQWENWSRCSLRTSQF